MSGWSRFRVAEDKRGILFMYKDVTEQEVVQFSSVKRNQIFITEPRCVFFCFIPLSLGAKYMYEF